MYTSRQHGFTLIEIMMAFVIVAILSGLLFGTLSIFRKSEKQATTQVTLTQLSSAINNYIDIYGVLGDEPDSSDFVADPVSFLVDRREAAGLSPLFSLNAKVAGRATVPPAQRYETIATPLEGVSNLFFEAAKTSPREATHFVDAYGMPIRITVFHRNVAGSASIKYPSLIVLSSWSGTTNDSSDDIEYYYNNGDTLTWNDRSYPSTSGTWDFFDREADVVVDSSSTSTSTSTSTSSTSTSTSSTSTTSSGSSNGNSNGQGKGKNR